MIRVVRGRDGFGASRVGASVLLAAPLFVAATVPARAQTQGPPSQALVPASRTAMPNLQKAVPDVQTVAPGVPPTAPAPAASGGWLGTVTYGAQVDAGITGNFDRPADGLDYGRLFGDRANTVLLNQVQLTAQRPVTGGTGYDLGFVLQGAYGTDARYTHFLGEFDRATGDREQVTLLQADLLLHTPWLTRGGTDLKLGQFLIAQGYEAIDPGTNPFYSHSYIFSFGPYLNTGLQAVVHVTPRLDLYGEVDTGDSTTFGGGDENAEPAGLVGFGLNNLLHGRLTVLATSHLGPEDAADAIGRRRADRTMRYESDVLSTLKATPRLTLVLELNWLHDDLIGANAYGGAGYASYALTRTLAANVRGEIYRDDSGFFVAADPGNLDSIRAMAGLPNTAFTAGRQVYSEWTVGLTYRPTVSHATLLAFRPEIRWDKSLGSGRPYNALTSTGSLTLGGDVILGF